VNRAPGALLAVALGVALLAAVAYRGALGAGWVWDDRLVVSQQLPRFHGVRDAFFPPRDVPRLVPQYYRPVVILSWLADDARARSRAAAVRPGAMERLPADPGGELRLDAARQRAFHATNVALHAASAALVTLLAAALAGWAAAPRGVRPLAPAALAGALFALHPLAVEPVTWAAGRSDLLAGFFVLAALLAFGRGVARGGAAAPAAAGLLYLAALLSKESAVGAFSAFVPLALAVPRAGCDPAGVARARRALGTARALAPLAGALVAYALLRGLAAGPQSVPALTQAAGRLGDALAALGWAVERALWPVPMQVFVVEVFTPARAALGAALVGAALAAMARVSRPGGRGLVAAVAAWLFLGPLLPTLAAVVGELTPVVTAERYLYLPLAGLAIGASAAAAWLGDRFARRTPGVPWIAALPAAAVALLLLPAWWATASRVATWSDEERLWTLAEAQAPGVMLPSLNLGLAFDRAGRAEDAIAAYRRAAGGKGSDRGRALACSHLGAALLAQDRLAEAVAALTESVALDPRAARTQYNLAHALVRQAEQEGEPAVSDNLLQAALPHFEAALESDPGYTLARFHYGDILARLGQADAGIAALEQGLARDPGHAQAGQARRLLERLRAESPSAPPPAAAGR
jgi:tetratricopeptide (TPR) repeat protein